MAHVSISQAVGVRNGTKMMPNLKADLDRITALFDAIPSARGGTRDTWGAWMTDRDFLIAEVTAQITAFQTVNNRPVVDGVVDPGGGTLKLMNQLAGSGVVLPITATVVPAPAGYAEEMVGNVFQAVEIGSMPGTAPMRPVNGAANFVRKLVKVENCSIKWFGVLFPRNSFGTYFGASPHIFFTPSPIQGGYTDYTYDSFGGKPPWGKLWHDYTWGMGRQIQLAGADQVLVIPFYKTGQHGNLGDFLDNWKQVVSAVVTAAIDAVDPNYLRDTYEFDTIYSSSFSNGWVPHAAFNSKGAGAAAMTRYLFDLDGQAASPPSAWRPSNGVIYLNRPVPRGANPAGNLWYVGGRWNNFVKYWPEGFRPHNACASYLLYHGIWQYCM